MKAVVFDKEMESCSEMSVYIRDKGGGVIRHGNLIMEDDGDGRVIMRNIGGETPIHSLSYEELNTFINSVRIFNAALQKEGLVGILVPDTIILGEEIE